jgi:hypothetical protein
LAAMKKWILCSGLGALLMFLLTQAVAGQPAAATLWETRFEETFTTTLYQDAAFTTTVWDTSAGQVRLPAPVPQEEGVAAQLYAAVSGHSAVYVPDQDRVYVIGGSGNLMGIQVYDPEITTTYRSRVQMPYRLAGAAAFYAPTRRSIYVLGGGAHQQVLILNVDTMATQALPHRLPDPVSYAAVAYVPEQDKAYLYGGFNADGTVRNTILQYDLASGSVITLPVTLPISASMNSAVYDAENHAVYIFGGQIYSYPLSGILKFDVREHTLDTIGVLPVASSAFSTVYVPDQRRAFLFGGMDATQSLSQTVVFDAASESASLLPAFLPLPRYGSAAAYDSARGKAYIFGGQYVFYTLGDIMGFEPGSDTLDEIVADIGARSGATSVYVPSRQGAYVFGGQDATGAPTNTIVAFDEQRMTTRAVAATLPISLTDVAAVYDTSTRQAYLFGGAVVSQAAQCSSGILRFDVDTEAISVQTATLPQPRSGMAVAYVESEKAAYLFGGAGPEGCSDRILVYHTAEDRLVELANHLPSPVAYAAAAYDDVGKTVYLFGGWNPAATLRYLDQIVAFDLRSQTARLLSVKLPIMRARATVVSIPGERTAYVVGGTYGAARHWADVLRFDTLKGTVQRVPNMSLGAPRSAATGVFVPEQLRMLLFGGVGTSDHPMADVVVLRMAYSLTGTAQSLMVNTPGQSVTSATLQAEQTLRGGEAEYWLSNDGGAGWDRVQSMEPHSFDAPGADLRWRLVMRGNGLTTPHVDAIQILYNGPPQYSLVLPLLLR